MDLSAPLFWIALCGLTSVGAGVTNAVRFGGRLVRGAGDDKDGWKQRRLHLLVGGFIVAFAFYGSYVPFDFQSVDLGGVVADAVRLVTSPMRPVSRTNFIVNVLLFIPIGYLATAAWLGKNASRIAAVLIPPIVYASCLLLSFLLEIPQFWLPTRVPSQDDIVAQAIGAAAGISIRVVGAKRADDWLYSLAQSSRPKTQLDRWLQAYLVGLVIYCLVPFNPLTRVADVVRKYRAGRITLLPFSDVPFTWEGLFQLVVPTAIFIPVGVMVSVCWLKEQHVLRPVRKTLVLGSAIAGSLEFAQACISGRFASSTDVLMGFLGVAIGSWYIRRAALGESRSAKLRETAVPSWYFALALLMYSVAILGVFCFPRDVISDAVELSSRFERLWTTSFMWTRGGDDLLTAADILKKVMLFVPFGVLVTKILPQPPNLNKSKYAVLATGAITLGFGVLIESLQVFLPAHTGDLSGSVVYAIGGMFGSILHLRVERFEQELASSADR